MTVQTRVESVDQSRKVLFAKKGEVWKKFLRHQMHYCNIRKAVYQAGYCWSQSLLSQQILPDPNEWGWKYDASNCAFTISWMTIPQASTICQKLIRCSCNKDKGCKRAMQM